MQREVVVLCLRELGCMQWSGVELGGEGEVGELRER